MTTKFSNNYIQFARYSVLDISYENSPVKVEKAVLISFGPSEEQKKIWFKIWYNIKSIVLCLLHVYCLFMWSESYVMLCTYSGQRIPFLNVLFTGCLHFRVTMPSYGEQFRKFYSDSESPLFQVLGSLINPGPSLMEGLKKAMAKR